MPETEEITRYNELLCPSCCLELLKNLKGLGTKKLILRILWGCSSSLGSPHLCSCPSPNSPSASFPLLFLLGCLDGTKVISGSASVGGLGLAAPFGNGLRRGGLRQLVTPRLAGDSGEWGQPWGWGCGRQGHWPIQS